MDDHPNFVDVWKEMEKLLETGQPQAWYMLQQSPTLLTYPRRQSAVHWRVRVNSNTADVGDDSVLRESRCAHEMQNVLALALEA